MNKRRLINGLMIAGLISPLIILPFAGFGRDAAPAQDRGSEEVFGNPELPLFSDRFEPPIELTINSNVPSIHASSSQMLTFTFAEDVFGFDADDILIGPGAFTGQFSQVNAAVYTLEVQSSGGRITVNVPNRAALSAISGTGTAAASFSNFRSDRPTISLPGGETMVLIRVPAGSFMMGSPEDELSRRDDEAQHEVTLSRDFYIGRDEVTQAQWLAVMGDFPEPQAHGLDDTLAVHNISHNDIMDPATGFMKRLNDHLIATNQPFLVTLPTESQWEYAARASTSTRFSFGDGFAADELCELGGGRDENIWFCGNAGGATQPVTLKLPNPWGLHDMHGNVFEWCLGWMGDYPVGPVTDPVGPETGTGRVRRGGSWNSAARDTRSASRNSGSPDMRNIATGFRVAAARPATLNISSNQEDIHQSSSQRLTFTLNGFEDFDGSGITIRGADLVDFRPFDPDNPFFWIMDLNNIGGPVTVTVPADAAVPFPPATTSTVASFSNFYQDTWTLQLRELNGEPVTMDMIRIPPGSFMMGAPNNEQGSFSQERPQFEATVEDAFYMSKTEVTQDQIVSIRSIQAIPPFPAAQTFIGGSLPVHNLTKSDGDFATDRLFEHLVVSGQIFIPGPGVPTVSLPTEIQWEYAARAGTTTRFSFGDGFASNDLCTLGGGREDHMWFCGNAAGSAQVVGQKLPNPWGVYDMHGNVSEWTATNFNIYPLPGVNPPLKDFSVRGGSWFRQARETRSAWRTPRDPGTRSSTIGFRVVINPDIRN